MAYTTDESGVPQVVAPDRRLMAAGDCQLLAYHRDPELDYCAEAVGP